MPSPSYHPAATAKATSIHQTAPPRLPYHVTAPPPSRMRARVLYYNRARARVLFARAV